MKMLRKITPFFTLMTISFQLQAGESSQSHSISWEEVDAMVTAVSDQIRPEDYDILLGDLEGRPTFLMAPLRGLLKGKGSS